MFDPEEKVCRINSLGLKKGIKVSLVNAERRVVRQRFLSHNLVVFRMVFKTQRRSFKKRLFCEYKNGDVYIADG